MRKTVLIPLVLGLVLLIVGVVQSYSSLAQTIRCTGTIHSYPEEQPQQTAQTTRLDIIGLLAILIGIGFFTVAYLNKKR